MAAKVPAALPAAQPSKPVDYAYDAASRLKGVSQTGADGATGRYNYDDSGNLASIDRFPSPSLSVLSVVPARGSTGATVTISGTGFATTPAGNTVSFNGKAATVSAATATTLTVVVPAGATSGTVTVVTSAGSATSQQVFTVDAVVGAPVVSSFSPALGAPGASITVTGSGFAPSAADDIVVVGATRAVVTAASATQLTVTVPDASISGPVSVKTPVGTASSTTDFIVVPRGYAAADVAATPVLQLDGTPSTVTVPSGKVAVLRFSGTQGQRLSLGLTGSTISTDFTVAGLSPFGVPFATIGYNTPWKLSQLFGGLELPPLPTTGVYEFVLDPPGTGSGSVTATLSSRVSGTLSMTGAGTAVTLSRAGQQADLVVPAVAGQDLHIGFTGSTFASTTTATTVIREPNGTAVEPTPGTWRYRVPLTGAGDMDIQVSQTGDYHVILGSADSSTGAVTVTASPTLDAGTLTAGVEKSVSITRPGQDAKFAFAGTAGNQLSLDFTAYSFGYAAYVDVYAPDGTAVMKAQVSNYHQDIPALPVTGTYVLTMSPYSTTGSATLRLTTRVDAGSLTTAGAATAVSFSQPAQTAALTFTGAAGQGVSFGFGSWTLPANSSLSTELVDPQGSVVYRYGPVQSLASLWYVPVTSGTFRLLLTPNDAVSTGSVSVTMSAEQAGGALAIGTSVTTSAPRAAQTTRYTFTGAVGQRLSFDFSAYTFVHNVGFMVINPDASVLSNGFLPGAELDLAPLTAAGTYQVVVYPLAETGSMRLTLAERVDAGATSVGGAAKTLTVAQAGRYAETSFTATAGQRLTVGLTNWTFASGTTLRVSIIDASGNAIADDILSNGGADEAIAPAAGTYRFILAPIGFVTGAATLTLSEQLNGGTLALNTAKTITFARAGQSSRLTYAGTAGQNLALTMPNGTLPVYPYLRVSKPDGTALTTAPGGASVSIPTLPATGTYTFTLSPYSYTGNITVNLTTRAAAAAQRAQADALQPPLLSSPAPGVGLPGPKGTAEHLAPLPAGDRADVPSQPVTGDVHWTPDSRNLAGADWNTHTASVSANAPANLQAPAGTTALSGRILTLDGHGLAQVTVSVEGTHTTTGPDGRFLLTGLGAGHRVLRVNGATANTGDRQFGLHDIGVDLTGAHTTALPYPVWLTALDTAHEVHFASPADHEVVVTNPAIPGLEVHLPAGAVVRDVNGGVVTTLGITAIPVDKPPFPLPKSNVPVYFTVQPGSAYVFPTGARVVYPNYTAAAAGAVMDFWHYDPTGRGWFVYGHGHVTADRKQVVPDKGTEVYQFTGAMLIEPGTAPPPDVAPMPGGGATGADPVDLGTGLLTDTHTDLSIDDTLPISVTRHYQSSDTAPRGFGTGFSSDYNMYLYAQQQWIDGQLILPDGGRVRYHRITPGGTGPADYQTAVFAADPTPTNFAGSVMAWNGNGFDVRLRDGTTYVFGEEAPLQAIRDKFGNTVTVTRAAAPADPDGVVRDKGPITQVTSPHGKWISFAYNTTGQVTRVQDDLGRAVGYTYQPDGHLATVTDTNLGVTTYTYDPSGGIATIKDPRNTVYLTNQYDTAGRVKKQTAVDGSFYQIAYTTDTSGRVTETTLTDPNGHVRKVDFNSAGFTTSDTLAVGTPQAQATTFVRDPVTNVVTSSTDALGRRTDFGYDAYAHVTSVTQLAGTSGARSEIFEYNGPYDQISRTVDWLNKPTVYGYGPNAALHTITDPMSHVTTVDTGSDGQVTKVTDNLSHPTVYGYTLGDLSTITDALGRVSTQVVDRAGRVTGARDPTGATTTTVYDPQNQVKAVTDPLGHTTSFGYDPNGNLTTTTDPRLHTTVTGYDLMDRVATVTDPLSRQTVYGYDPGGNLTSVKNPSGLLTTYDHDALDRPSTTRFGVTGQTSQSQTVYGYDAGNRLRTVTDSVGGTITITPNDLDQVTQVASPQGTIGYRNDAAHRVGMTAPGQSEAVYGYNDDGQLKSVTRGTEAAAIGYDGAGRRSTLTLPDGVVQTYGYDNANQLSSIGYARGATTLGDLSYSYDAAGRVTHLGGSYARSSVPAAYGPATFDAANQITAAAGRAYTYDLDGNLTSDGLSTSTWNPRGQLASTTRAGQTTTYGYDGVNRRTSVTAGAATTGYLYDGLDAVAELSGAATTANMLTAGGETFDRNNGAATVSLLSDRLGSTLATANATGALTAEYSYEPFGATTVTGDDAGNPTRFTGQHDDGGGQYYDRARYYSTGDQRFTSQDPLGFASGDTDLYAYVGGDPTNLVDPLGTKPQGVVTIYRGTGLYMDTYMFNEVKMMMSEAAQLSYMEEGASVSQARAASEVAHAEAVASWGDENTYAEAHGEFGTEMSELAPRTMISFSTDPDVAKNFARGASVYSATINISDGLWQPNLESTESEVLIRNMIAVELWGE
jgi:RHS repeat-associated protein